MWATHSFKRVHEIQKIDLRSVRLSARQPAHMKQLVYNGRIFIKFNISAIFFKFVEKFQALLKYDKNNGNFTYFTYILYITIYIFYHISVTYS